MARAAGIRSMMGRSARRCMWRGCWSAAWPERGAGRCMYKELILDRDRNRRMSYEVLWESRGAIKRFWGVVSSQDMLRSVVETEADVRFDRLRYVINDFLAATQIGFSAKDVSDIAAMDLGASRTNAAIKIAVVATMPELLEFARQYASSPLNAYPTRV